MTIQRLLIALAAVLLPFTVHATKIYKWVDENGVPHYTTTPPPETQKDVEQMHVDTKRKSSAALEEVVPGVWMHSANGYIQRMSLFTNNTYRLVKRRGGKKYIEDHSGRWALNARNIVLTSRDGKEVEKIIIRDAEPGELKVQRASGALETFVSKFERYAETHEEKLIEGDWYDRSQKMGFELIAGNFELAPGRNPNKATAGNYELSADGKKLKLVFVFDRQTKTQQMVAQRQEWTVQQLDFRNLILTRNGKRWHFTRERPLNT